MQDGERPIDQEQINASEQKRQRHTKRRKVHGWIGVHDVVCKEKLFLEIKTEEHHGRHVRTERGYTKRGSERPCKRQHDAALHWRFTAIR